MLLMLNYWVMIPRTRTVVIWRVSDSGLKSRAVTNLLGLNASVFCIVEQYLQQGIGRAKTLYTSVRNLSCSNYHLVPFLHNIGSMLYH